MATKKTPGTPTGDPARSADEQAPDEQAPDDLAGLSYEQAREELIRVVQQLESGGAPLAESLALWERGERLANRCQEWLDGARATVEAASRRRTPDAQD